MKITIFIGGLAGGGAERVVCNLSNFLSANHDVTILTMSNNKPGYNLTADVKRISLSKNQESNNYILKNFRRLIRFRKYIKNSSSDVYVTMLPITINIMLFFRKIINVPIIISERNDPVERFESSYLKKRIMKQLYPKANGFVFQTEEAKSYYTGILGGKGVVIPNAINSEFIKSPYKGQRAKKIVSAGRFSEQKNFHMLIEAFSEIASSFPDYELVIYGEGALRSALEKQIFELGIDDKVFFPGYVPDIGNHIFNASIFILPSNYEGMPNALMEAMALGLSCISTDCPVGGPRYLIKNGENGILIPVKSKDKLIAAIEQLITNKDLADRLGSNATEIVNTLNPEIIYKEWESYINKVTLQKK